MSRKNREAHTHAWSGGVSLLGGRARKEGVVSLQSTGTDQLLVLLFAWTVERAWCIVGTVSVYVYIGLCCISVRADLLTNYTHTGKHKNTLL